MMLLPQQLTSPNILNPVLLFQLFIALSLGIDSSPRNCYVFTYVHPQDVTPCVQLFSLLWQNHWPTTNKRGGRVNLSSQFEAPIYHGWESMVAGTWRSWAHCAQSQRVLLLGSFSPFCLFLCPDIWGSAVHIGSNHLN